VQVVRILADIKITRRVLGEIIKNRAENGANATLYVVRAVNKNNSVSRARPCELDVCKTLEAAAKRRVDLLELNPGRQFIVCEE
jgi:hypothetical protein